MVTLRHTSLPGPRSRGPVLRPATLRQRVSHYPLSNGQERLWTLAALQPELAAYNLPYAVWFEGDLDESALRAAFEEMVARHEILRTSLQLVDGSLRQVVHDAIPLPLEFRSIDPAESSLDRPAWAQARIVRLASRPFDLAAAPLFRAEVIAQAPQRHLLAVVMHHAIVDGASLGIFVQELISLYRRRAMGGEPVSTLPPVAAQFGDYALVEAAELGGDAAKAKRNHWREYLKDCVPVLALPHDRTRPERPTRAGDGVAWAVDPALGQALKAFCREHRTTLYSCLLAAMYVLLHRYSGQRDILVGTPALNRRDPRFAGLIGFFANTIVVRAQVTERQTFVELLRQVHQQVIRSLAHEDLPFDEIVRASGVTCAADNPLFQVLFQVQRGNAGGQEVVPGTRLAPQPVRNGSSKFDLHVALSEQASGAIEGCWEFATELFERETIERMAANFTTLLRALVAWPHALLRHVPLISAPQRAELAAIARRPALAAAGAVTTISAQFAARAAECAEAVAIVAEDDTGTVQHTTFGELERRADRIAAALFHDCSVRPGEVVGVCIERSPELIAVLLAILKCGAAYLPIDPALPRVRRDFVLHDAQARLVVTGNGAGDFADSDSAVARMPVGELERRGMGAAVPAEAATPDTAAYVLYTSGSSGRPKGVVLEHRSVVNTLRYMQERFPVGKGDAYLLKTNVMFDVSVTELFGWFFGHGRLVIARGDIARDPELIVNAVARHQVTHLNFVPSMLALFSDTLAQPQWAALHALRYLMVAGEAFGTDLAAKLARLPASVQVNNIYGPTEAAIYATNRRVRRTERGPVVPIGVPLDGTSAHVVDPHGDAVPLGAQGELVLGGAGLARGYLNNPELTHARFTPAPQLDEPRIYRTGDLARWNVEREIEYLGRLDRQVKVRGFRIEIPEIETHLAAHEQVSAAVVVDRTNPAGQTELWAYCVLREALTAEALRAFLAERLPVYMVPGRFVRLAALPMLPSGKVDRGALPVTEALPMERGAVVVPPRTALERSVHLAWRDALGGGEFGIHDDFFALGGHSLIAVRLANRLNREHGIELPLSVVFHANTIAKLAERVAGAPRREPLRASTEVHGPLPATRAQLRMFAAQQVDPAGTSYNVPQVFAYPSGRLDPAAVRSAGAALLRRHEALRTTFRYERGEVVAGIADGDFDVLTVRAIDAADRDRVVRDFVRAFDLSRPPLFRILLAEYPDGGGVLCFDTHHIAVDGVSGTILLREFVELYNGGTVPPGADDLRKAIARRERTAEAVRLDSGYWRRTLAGAGRPLCLPIEAPRGGPRIGRMFTTELPAAVLADVRRAATRWSVTPNILLLAVFDLVLARATGQHDLVVGMPIAGRDGDEMAAVVGNFVNTLPLRAQPKETDSFAGFLQEVRASVVDGMAHSHHPIDEIASELGLRAAAGRNALFDVMFEVRTVAGAVTRPRLRGVDLEPIQPDVNVAKMDLVVTVVLEEQRASCHWHYDSALISAENVARWAGDFCALAARACTDAGPDLAALAAFEPAEPAAEFAGASTFDFT